MVRLFNYDVSDQLGFYKVGDLRFYGKFDAVKVMENTGQHLTFHYHDEAFASHDWTREPQASLEELYRQRAQQLREQYDYLVICYSGGADSDNILDSFVNNGIPVDEILTYYGSRFGKDRWYNAEVFRVAVPKAQAIVDRSPETRLRLLDVTEHMIEFWANGDEEDLDSLLHRHGTGYNAFGMAWVNQVATLPDYVRL